MRERLKQPVPLAIYAVAVLISVGFALVGAFDTGKTGLYLGTAGLTLLLSGFIFAIQPNFDKRTTRLGAFLTVGLAILGWASVLLMIWNINFQWLDDEMVMQLGMSFMVLFPAALLIAGSVAIFNPTWKRLGWMLMVGFSLIAGLVLFTIWVDWKRDTLVPIIFSLSVTTLLVGPLMPTSPIPPLLRGAVILVAALACIVLTRILIEARTPIGLRLESDPTQILRQLDLVLVAAGIVITTSVLNAVMVLHLERANWLRWLTVASVACTVILLGIGMHTLFVLDFGGFLSAGRMATTIGEMPVFIRLGIASSIITLALGLAMGFMARSNRSIVESAHSHLLALTCPRCGRGSQLGEGAQACPWCRLQFRLSFEAPDCRVCGTILAPNNPARCPECGTEVVMAPGPDDSPPAGTP